MKKFLLIFCALALFACQKSNVPEPEPAAEPIVYIVNEGWFGHEMGDVNRFDFSKGIFEKNLFASQNDKLTLGATTCYGTRFDGKFYFVSKQGNRLVQANGSDFKHIATLTEIGGDGRAFAGVNQNEGVVTTSKGAFRVSLNPLKLGAALEGTDDKQCGAVAVVGDYVFVINSAKGIQIYSVSQGYKLVKELGKGSVGFVEMPTGLWAANDNELLKIDPTTLNVETIVLPEGVKINSSWGAWNKGSLCGDPKNNVLYFAKSGAWGGGNAIYRYVIGEPKSLEKVFATSNDAEDSFYGAGIAVNPTNGMIVATFTKDGWGENYANNRLVFFSPQTGNETGRYLYSGYFFPAMILF